MAALQRAPEQFLREMRICPTDPDLMLPAQDGWTDPVTGQPQKTRARLWLIRRGQKARPILPADPQSSDHYGHEWWDRDGQSVWYIDYQTGTRKVDLLIARLQTIGPQGHTHSHCDASGRFVVGDIHTPPDAMWKIAFFDAATRHQADIVPELPSQPSPGHYHLQPHPQFCLQDQDVCYPTSVLGPVEVTLILVRDGAAISM